MKIAAIRQAFLDYYKQLGHEIVPSSSLVPGNDATLLFTNAGMVQFKDVFLGDDKRPYNRAVSSQRCVRAGGKHNDLENVGYTARHHTFFEMLGNFSFGDYFKQDAIKFAWNFLTVELGLPAEKLWVTVHHSDSEAEKIWFDEIGINQQRFSRLDEDNFWSMGDTGPCGPCSEIFYDHGEDIWGGPPGSLEEDGDRYIEIWNMVFMQYNRDSSGEMTPLPQQSIDTGMGLERIAAILQNVHSNYEIDLFQNLLQAAVKIIGTDDVDSKSLQVIADHIRSVSFLILDGVVPSNEGRGYVLRRIMRRAIRHGNKLGAQGSFLHQLVAPLVQEMGEAYPDLKAAQVVIEKVIVKEERQFVKTLDQGMRILEQDLADLKGDTIAGDTIFKLYDTFGFPVDLTADIARERHLEMDMGGFEEAMEQQRLRARSASSFAVDYSHKIDLTGQTDFQGYVNLTHTGKVLAIIVNGERSDRVSQKGKLQLVLDSTSFYAESGGQTGDQGMIEWSGGSIQVTDTLKQGQHFVHYGHLIRGELGVGDVVDTFVDGHLRADSAKNHSATHLLHEAMRRTLGDHVTQKGSLVNPDRLRFDFSHSEPVSAVQLAVIEAMVNEEIRDNTEVAAETMAIDDAKAAGAMALFGEKYGDEVRVITMGNPAAVDLGQAVQVFSLELCGGTHVERTGDIGAFIITSESGVAAGVRRVEALTGAAASEWLATTGKTLAAVSSLVRASRDKVTEKVQALIEKNRQLERELEHLQVKMAASQGADLVSQAKEIHGVKVLISVLEGVEPKSLRDAMDQLRNKLGSGVVMLAVIQEDKASIVAGVTKDLIDKVKAGELIRHTASNMSGKGGGRPDMAQGGGQADQLTQALASAHTWLEESLI
ncbi:MAG: alanine--tRNA ligase [Oceanospirillaceae bacterium]|nr:alanine--tRNA ligase [Oceanospirillaceae bacterium]MBT6101110.1 alanine--tRNA ligase [Oceanospirillaceae bacterium]